MLKTEPAGDAARLSRGGVRFAGPWLPGRSFCSPAALLPYRCCCGQQPTPSWLPAVYGRNPIWHAHEMVYGFTSAVIVGFLFTAGRNWTNQPTPTGRLLAALVLLWSGWTALGVLTLAARERSG